MREFGILIATVIGLIGLIGNCFDLVNNLQLTFISSAAVILLVLVEVLNLIAMKKI